MVTADVSTRRSDTKRGLKSTSSPIGWCPMCSTPPASTMSHAPYAISPAPAVTAVSAPAHMRSTAKPGTDCGMPASKATSRPRVNPWSPTWAVAAKMTSPIRSGGTSGFRRSNSRTTLTAISSARVFQKMPCGPARPKAVRTPSTNTTARRSILTSLRGGFELLAQILELPAVRRERVAVELDQERAACLELAVAVGVQQALWAIDGERDRHGAAACADVGDVQGSCCGGLGGACTA